MTTSTEPATGQEALDGLVRLLDLETLEVNLFRGVSPPHSLPRVFGGQVAAQALVAAGRTVPEDREVHSLHAYFIRPGDPAVPIVTHGPSWAAVPGNLSIALVVALACFGFYAARGGQPLFGKLQV